MVDKGLENFRGSLQTDGYSGYGHQHERKDLVCCFGCWAHARRKFMEVIKTSKQKTGKAQEGMAHITALYYIERKAKEENLNFANRKKLRQSEAKPILEEFQVWLLKSIKQVPPQSGIAQAINYTLNQWKYLITYVDHGEIKSDRLHWEKEQALCRP